MSVSHAPFSRTNALVRIGSKIDEREAQRIERFSLALSEKSPPWLAEYIQKASPLIGIVGAISETLGPLAYRFYAQLYEAWCRLPKNMSQSIWGICVCFFGGRYCITISAMEAFQAAGGSQMLEYIHELHDQLADLSKASAEDDMVDADNDGIADVDQISPTELGRRKFALALRTVDPQHLSHAVGGLYTGCLGVLAVLKLQYARTIALAHSIGENLRAPVAKIFAPAILHLTPPEYRQWISPSINFACKLVAMLAAWRIRRTISSVQSGVKGGLIFSRAFHAFLQEKKLMQLQDDDTVDFIGWSVAAAGIYHQLVRGGGAPFLLAPILWPLGITERVLEWSVTWGNSQAINPGAK